MLESSRVLLHFRLESERIDPDPGAGCWICLNLDMGVLDTFWILLCNVLKLWNEGPPQLLPVFAVPGSACSISLCLCFGATGAGESQKRGCELSAIQPVSPQKGQLKFYHVRINWKALTMFMKHMKVQHVPPASVAYVFSRLYRSMRAQGSFFILFPVLSFLRLLCHFLHFLESFEMLCTSSSLVSAFIHQLQQSTNPWWCRAEILWRAESN